MPLLPVARPLTALALVILLAACGSSGAGQGGTTGGTTGGAGGAPTPTPTPLGGAPGGDPGASPSDGGAGGPGDSAEPGYEEITPGIGERTLLDVELLAGDMTWDGTVDWAGDGSWDRWNVQVDLVIRRSPGTGGLVFAKGSTFSLDWDTGRELSDASLCTETQAHWTGDIGTPSGEGWDPLSETNPEGVGIVWEDLHSLRLDISLAGTRSGDWCSFPGVKLSCPLEPAAGQAAIWQQTIDDPARLDFSCTDVSPASSSSVYTINTRGLLQEAQDVPPAE